MPASSVACSIAAYRLSLFGAFHFEMHTVEFRDNVLTFQPGELLPASSSNSQGLGYGFRGFEFAAFALIA